MAGKIKDMDRLEKSLHSLRWSTQFDALDEQLLEKAMGSEALAKWRAIRNLPMRLLEQGLVSPQRLEFHVHVCGPAENRMGHAAPHCTAPQKREAFPPHELPGSTPSPILSRARGPTGSAILSRSTPAHRL